MICLISGSLQTSGLRHPVQIDSCCQEVKGQTGDDATDGVSSIPQLDFISHPTLTFFLKHVLLVQFADIGHHGQQCPGPHGDKSQPPGQPQPPLLPHLTQVPHGGRRGGANHGQFALIFPRQTVAQPPFLQECLRIVYCFKQCRDMHEIDVPRRSRKIGTAADSGETRQIQPSLSVHCWNETHSESRARERAVRGLFRLILADLRRPRYFISLKNR